MRRYIDADELKRKIEHEFDMQDTYLPVHFLEVMDGVPTADVQEVRHGRWEPHELINRKKGCTSRVPWGYDCTFCGEWFVVGDEPIKRYHYCPHCGALMEREEE